MKPTSNRAEMPRTYVRRRMIGGVLGGVIGDAPSGVPRVHGGVLGGVYAGWEHRGT